MKKQFHIKIELNLVLYFLPINSIQKFLNRITVKYFVKFGDLTVCIGGQWKHLKHFKLRHNGSEETDEESSVTFSARTR